MELLKKGVILLTIITLIFSLTTYVVAYEENFEDLPQKQEGVQQYQEEPQEHNAEAMQEEYFRAEVLSVRDLESEDDYFEFVQQAEVVITRGDYRGQIFTIENPYLENHHYFNIYLEEDMNVILLGEESNGELTEAYLHDISRDRAIVYLLLIFIILLILIGGWHGVKTIITLLMASIVVLKVMIPALLAGYSPVPVAILSAVITIIPMLLIIGGINSKSLSAIIGTAVGVLVAGGIALAVGRMASLTGFSGEGAQMLAVMDSDLDLQGLLFAGIIIGSLGAVTDVSMSIASAITEIYENNPSLGTKDLISSGLNVGRDIMGTMANTLLLAYVGSTIPLLLLLSAARMPWLRIINMDLIVTEIVRGLAGSIGLIIAIPVTAVFAGIITSFD